MSVPGQSPREAVSSVSTSTFPLLIRAAWERALSTVTAAMTAGCVAAQPGDDGAAGQGTGTGTGGAAREPAWWLAEVVEHDRRRPDLAVLVLRPDPPLPYLPGQHISVQVPRWPRVWHGPPPSSPRPRPRRACTRTPCPAPPGRYDRPRETGCADGRGNRCGSG